MIDEKIINSLLENEEFKNIDPSLLINILKTLNSSENENDIVLKNKIEKILKI
tara:strand:- start:4289 stop:4447 length:159 start_codon:yes stop_codon:yes gene_type:complete